MHNLRPLLLLIGALLHAYSISAYVSKFSYQANHHLVPKKYFRVSCEFYASSLQELDKRLVCDGLDDRQLLVLLKDAQKGHVAFSGLSPLARSMILSRLEGFELTSRVFYELLMCVSKMKANASLFSPALFTRVLALLLRLRGPGASTLPLDTAQAVAEDLSCLARLQVSFRRLSEKEQQALWVRVHACLETPDPGPSDDQLARTLWSLSAMGLQASQLPVSVLEGLQRCALQMRRFQLQSLSLTLLSFSRFQLPWLSLDPRLRQRLLQAFLELPQPTSSPSQAALRAREHSLSLLVLALGKMHVQVADLRQALRRTGSGVEGQQQPPALSLLFAQLRDVLRLCAANSVEAQGTGTLLYGLARMGVTAQDL
eukprot:gene33292-40277_t